ncbi:MAG: energy transducer TonB [Bacteroidia bacterium]|nr:energy transducer TonB [Bacteroidia bacterium]
MTTESLKIRQFIRQKEKEEKRKLTLLIAEICVWMFMGGLIVARVNDLRKEGLAWAEPVTNYAYTFFYPQKEAMVRPIDLDSLRNILDTLVVVKDVDSEISLSSRLSEMLVEENTSEEKEKVEPAKTKKPKQPSKKKSQPQITQKTETVKPEEARMSLFGAELPEFPGGNAALSRFLVGELHYPDEARTESVEGKVLLRLWVEADGKVTDVSVVEGLGYGCDEEAIRIGKRMPKWKPGERQGRKTAMAAYIPVVFAL